MYFYQEFIVVFFFILFSFILSFFVLFLSLRVSAYNPDLQKLSAYECGFDPYEDARNVFDVRFYLVAILFIIFDLEAVYFYPWCVSFSLLNIEGFWGIIDFIIELIFGFIYAWEVGALEWE
jgi:NADH-quinone oxidoreductase subunit A